MSFKSDDRLKDRIAVITGAGSGLGRATAIRYAASGAKIVCADIKPDGNGPAIHTLIEEEYGSGRAIFVPCNVQNEDEIKSLFTKAVEWAGRVDIVCNYAGIASEQKHGSRRPLHETDVEDFDLTMSINVRGLFLCCKYAVVQMLAQPALPPNARGDETRGWIINAASIYGIRAVGGIPCYVTSKHAVVGLTKQIAVEYAPNRIHCNALCPGYIDTPFLGGLRDSEEAMGYMKSLHPWNELGKAEDIANGALFLASDEAAWVTGHTLVIDGAYTAK